MVHFRPAKVVHFDPARVVLFNPARVVYYDRFLQLGAINNSSYRQISDVDTLSASKDLRQLCDFELLLKKGDKKGTYYLPGIKLTSEPRALIEEARALTEEPRALIEEPRALTEEPRALIEEPRALTEELVERSEDIVVKGEKEILLGKLPAKLRENIQALKKRESNKEKISEVIIQLCKIRPYRLSELATLLDKGENYISTEYIKPLLGSKLDYKYPEVINHPNQAYKATSL